MKRPSQAWEGLFIYSTAKSSFQLLDLAFVIIANRRILVRARPSHGLVVPHAPDRPIRQRDRSLSQVTLRWREPLELTVVRSA